MPSSQKTVFFMKLILKEPFLSEFIEIQSIIGKENTYLIGGFVRDTLLGRTSSDMDFATPLHPDSFVPLFPKGDYVTGYGTLSFKERGLHITIAAFRKEEGYLDFRHPSKVAFITDMSEDSKRRDFTINALYANSDLEVLDPTQFGLSDLKNHIIRIIGDPDKRLIEDPLRILRAYRFAYTFDFTFDKMTKKSLLLHQDLIHQLKPQKIREELEKCPSSHRAEMIEALALSDEMDYV